MATYRTCDGFARRDFLKMGALGATGLSLASYLRAVGANEVAEARGKAAIFVNLGGGPSHIDTFDPKPNAPVEIRGELKPITTNVPGVEISELFPNLAQCADKFAILRGVSHTLAAHELGSQYLNSGNRPLPSLDFPGYGAVVSKELPGRPELPSFVAIPNTPQRAGYLGVQYAALSTNSMPAPNKPFAVRGVSLRQGLTIPDVERRRALLEDLDTAFRGLDADHELVGGLDEFSEQAYSIMTSQRSREAFDVSKESPAVAERFGQTGFGLSCLLACRLVESGVRFVTINLGGWDNHGKIYEALRTKGRAGDLDRGLAGMIATLSERGLLETTSICATGEFGRTPKINKNAGRDHWPRAMCVFMAGGGMRGGQVIGASDAEGAGPASAGITPEQVAASLYHSLGIDCTKEYQTLTGRPLQIVRNGSVIPELFSS